MLISELPKSNCSRKGELHETAMLPSRPCSSFFLLDCWDTFA